MGFQVIPAIDLRAGRVVRLVEGDFGTETVYGTDPLATALTFATGGARWLHLVDLDGARGEPRQTTVVEALVRGSAGRLHCQVGGGLRTEEAVAEMLGAGATRVVIGTAGLDDPDLLARVVASHGADHVAAALDVRAGLAVGEGWRDGAPGRPVAEALATFADAGIEHVVVTAIQRDGHLAGPDFALLASVVEAGRCRVTASGGISSVADLLAVRGLGCEAAIVGRALHEGRLDLAAAIAALAEG
jgi:phosphoribosylformimino-5-aminoimidazole carboxamide ribotide isomerase